MSSKAAALAKAKKDETKKVREQIAIFDGLLQRYYEAPAVVPGVSKKPYGPLSRGPFSRGNRERLIVEVRSTNGKLQRSRQILMDLIKSFHVDTPEVAEIKEVKAEIEQRMQREIEWESDVKKTPASDKALTQEAILTAEQETTRAALEFLSTTIEKLRRQVEVDSATVERVLAKNARLRADEQEEDQDEAERAERIVDLNNEREWHIERLDKIERMLLNEDADAEKALALGDFIDQFVDSNAEEGFDSDRSLYHSFGLDLPQAKEVSPVNPLQAVGVLREQNQTVPAAAGGQPDDVRPPLKSKAELPAARAQATLAETKPQLAAPSKGKTNGQEKKSSSNLRSIPCRTFSARRSCPYGDSCSFLHILPGSDVDVREERETAQMKARCSKIPCKYQEEVGGCKRRDCFFQHNAVEAKGASLFDFIGKKYPALAVEDVDVPPDSVAPAPTAAVKSSAEMPRTSTSPTLAFASIAKAKIQSPAVSVVPSTTLAPVSKALPSGPPAVAAPPPPRKIALSAAVPALRPSPATRPTPAPRPTPVAASVVPKAASSTTTSDSRSTRSQSSHMSDAGSVSSDASSGSIDYSPLTPASGSPIVAATRMPDGLLPLSANGCLNHFFQGNCLNGSTCLSRHTLIAEDHAAGVLPLLGPTACLGWHLKGFCLNGSACKASHRLTESDYGPLGSNSPQANSKALSLSEERQHYEDYRDSLAAYASRSISPIPQRFKERQPAIEPAPKVQQPGPPAPNTRRSFTDPRMNDPRFRASCCRFFLAGSCPYEVCFDIHPKGAFDLEIEENATTFFVPDSDSEDE